MNRPEAPKRKGLPSDLEAGMLPDHDAQQTLWQQVVNDRWLRLALAAIVLFLLVFAASLPKRWTSTPKGVTPVIKVSLLDRLQAWSLRRNARRLEAEGKLQEAILTWRQAIANDAGDVESNRGFLRALAAQRQPAAEHLSHGVARAIWVQRLSRSNLLDLELSARVFAVYRLDEFVLMTLLPHERSLSDAGAADLLKAQFRAGQMEPFGAVWAQHPGAAAADPELPLYHAAWQIAWGPPGQIQAGRDRLAAAKAEPATRALAHRLQLQVSEALADLAGYAATLGLLQSDRADLAVDHVRHWRLLISAGRKPEAAELARAFARPPETPTETQLMFDTFLSLGLSEYAAEFLGKHLPSFSFRPDLWVRQAELLIQLGRWDEVRLAALELRVPGRQGLGLTGYAWFLEGLANHRRQLTDPAEAAFRQLPKWPVEDALLGYRIATELTRLGHPKIAEQVLASLQQAAGGTAEYWFHVVTAAYEAREFETMAEAAEKGYRLAPEHLMMVNNYAAVLLMRREQPALAAQLTLRKLAATPDDPGARLNHAHALLQNDRLAEAEALLAGLDPALLDSRLSTVRQAALFELRFRQGRRAEALAIHPQIEQRFLLAPQLRWLEQTHAQLTAPAATKP